MKKVLSIILITCMLFTFAALAACTTTEPEVSEPAGSTPVSQAPASKEPEPEIDLSNTKPNEHVQEKLAAGMDVLCAFLAVEFGGTTMLALDEGFRNGFEGAGYKYASDTFNFDTTVQRNMIENYVTMGAALVVTLVFDASMRDTIDNATAAGTYICAWGGADLEAGISLGTTRDFAQFGRATADMMIAWAEYRYPGEVVKTAIIDSLRDESSTAQTSGMKDQLEKSGVINIVYEINAEELSVDTGFNFAQDVFTFDPETRLFLGWGFSQGLGISNYIAAHITVDPSEFGVFAADTDSEARDFTDQSSGPEGTFRGYIAVGGDLPYEGLLPMMLQLLEGTIEPGTVKNEPIFTYTNFGYAYDERN